MARETRSQGRSVLTTSAAVVIVIAGLHLGKPLLVPFLVAVFLSVMSLPAVAVLRQNRVPSGIAVLFTVLVEFLVLLGLGMFLAKEIPAFAKEFAKQVDEEWQDPSKRPKWLEDPAWLKQTILRRLEGDVGTLEPRETSTENAAESGPGAAADKSSDEERDVLSAAGDETDIPLLQSIINTLKPEKLLDASLRLFGGVFSFLGSFISLLTNSLLVVFTMAMLLLEATAISEKVNYIREGSNSRIDRYGRVIAQVQKYLFIKTIISLVTGAVIGIGLTLLGVKGAPLWGFVAFLLNYIPNIGSLLAALPAVLVAMVSKVDPGEAFLLAASVAVLFFAVNICFGSLLEPQLMGRSLGLSPLVVFTSMVFWGWTWGIAGMLLSVPLTMTVKIFLENTPDLQWLAVLLGNEAPKKPDPKSSS